MEKRTEAQAALHTMQAALALSPFKNTPTSVIACGLSRPVISPGRARSAGQRSTLSQRSITSSRDRASGSRFPIFQPITRPLRRLSRRYPVWSSI